MELKFNCMAGKPATIANEAQLANASSYLHALRGAKPAGLPLL
jgi:hypothetical protein